MLGTILTFTVDSQALIGNPLGDNPARRVDVYLPPQAQGAPLLVDLVGFSGGGPSHTNYKVLQPTIPERIDRLIASGAMPNVAIAFPDCATALGGNQYIDSAGTGAWAKFLIEECAPAVEARFGVGGAGRRGVFGKSSGGHGAMLHGLLHGGVFWNAVACHSGDMGFELMYPGMFGAVARALDKHGRSIAKFRAHSRTAKKLAREDWDALNLLLQAASFDPPGDRLPWDLFDGGLNETAWANWLSFDPLRMVESHWRNLSALKALVIDCGVRDEYNLVFGARRLHARLGALGVAHTYEEFDDTHSDIDYRVEVSLPILARALA
jgi:S-formylglutathione hydrolase FrmB